jgi:2-deoxy-D-gluconate 3-dehydrogenase
MVNSSSTGSRFHVSILDQFKLDGKVALVTGVGRGIGQAAALGLAEAGSDIAGLYHRHYEETQQQVEARGKRFWPVSCDLLAATVPQLDDVVRRVVDEFSQLDILVNNAGVIYRRPAIEFREQEWDAIIQVNLKALFFLSQAAARVMVKHGGGKIINIASLLSFQGGILTPGYAAAKSGVAGVTRALANEWAPLHINVNAIAPGYIATDMTGALQTDPDRNLALLNRIPAGRWGTPADLQGTVVLLASAASDYMHGTVVPVDGGWLSR